MRSSLWLANLGFLPKGGNISLLFLRLSLGGSLVILHGWSKFVHWQTTVQTFPDPLGMGRAFTLALTVFAELFCGAMIMAGILTRLMAAILVVFFGLIFFQVHGGDFAQPGAELSLLYLFGFGALLLAGAGRFSADEAGGPYALAGLGALAGGVVGYPLSHAFQAAEYKAATPLGSYLASIGQVLQDPTLRVTAWTTWILSILLLAAAGFWVGRILHRRRVLVETTSVAGTATTREAEEVVVMQPAGRFP